MPGKKSAELMRGNLRHVLGRDDSLLDLAAFNTVIVLVLENNNFYLVCFDIENNTVEVVDNMKSHRGIYSMAPSTVFKDRRSPWKAKNIMAAYLKEIKHPHAHDIAMTHVRRLKLAWATENNVIDCGVFAMRHVEVYKGADEVFEAGFSRDETTKMMQVLNFRMKIAGLLLISDLNVHKDVTLNIARDTINKMTYDKTLKRLEDAAAEQKECWDTLSRWVGNEQRKKRHLGSI